MPQVLSRATSPEGLRLRLKVPENLLYFNGHFKGTPVVPGVCEVKWVLAFLAQHLGRPFHLRTIEVLKFQKLLFPGQEFELSIFKKNHKWQFRLTSGNDPVGSGRMVEADPNDKNTGANNE